MNDALAATTRYEYRCWPDDATVFRKVLEYDFDFLKTEERVDVYLINPNEQNYLPKIRGGDHFDIKERIGQFGRLELWTKRCNERFPIRAYWCSVLERLSFLENDLTKTASHPRRLVESLQDNIIVRGVNKRRRLYQRESCSAEIAQIEVEGQHFETIAFECLETGFLENFMRRFAIDLPNAHYGQFLMSGLFKQNFNRV